MAPSMTWKNAPKGTMDATVACTAASGVKAGPIQLRRGSSSRPQLPCSQAGVGARQEARAGWLWSNLRLTSEADAREGVKACLPGRTL
jgi:hypothetical protein